MSWPGSGSGRCFLAIAAISAISAAVTCSFNDGTSHSGRKSSDVLSRLSRRGFSKTPAAVSGGPARTRLRDAPRRGRVCLQFGGTHGSPT